MAAPLSSAPNPAPGATSNLLGKCGDTSKSNVSEEANPVRNVAGCKSGLESGGWLRSMWKWSEREWASHSPVRRGCPPGEIIGGSGSRTRYDGLLHGSHVS